MNKQPTTSKSGFKATFHVGLLAASVFLLSGNTSQAGSATWNANPSSRNWNTATNWTPSTVPNAPTNTATFATSVQTSVSISAETEVNGIVFNAGASAFTITASATEGFTLTLSGVGLTNNSGIAQNFVNVPGGPFKAGQVGFVNSATAGRLTVFTNKGGAAGSQNGGFIKFFDSASAGNGTFTNEGATAGGAFGGETDFADSSTAANGTFTTNGAKDSEGSSFVEGLTQFFNTSTAGNGIFTTNGGAVNGATPGFTVFYDSSTAGNGAFTTNGGPPFGPIFKGGGITFLANSSTAGNGIFINNGATVSGEFGGETFFRDSTTAGNATMIANGGSGGGAGGVILFLDKSRGGTARVEVFGNGRLDISLHNAPGVTVGSIEGDGYVFLAANNLSVGSNNLSTNFSGVITDRGGITDGRGGSLTKIGTGKLVLSHRNFYPGGTTVNRGRLLVNNIGGSGTGSGLVQVNRGKLGGKGEIAGAVTVGTGTGFGAVLAPGYLHGMGSPGALTIQSPLTFNSDATYEVGMNSSSVMRDEVVALGVTINGGAQFAFVDIGSGSLPAGTTFTVINNTAATPIAGTFSNLPDGSTFTSNGNSFKANYQGGDGNDLTLKVVP